MIQGGIDGYSWLITYLRASTDNTAVSVFSAFSSAVEKFGLPSRIRIDMGGENVLVSQLCWNIMTEVLRETVSYLVVLCITRG